MEDFEAVYDYRDAKGELLYQVVRKTDKGFRQRRPVGDGWEWNLKGVRRVLYRLPDVIAAVASGEAVWIPEGEKDCDRLASLGLTATTNSGGAGKWDDEHSRQLRGASVFILPDNDKPGEKHARDIASSLIRENVEARIVRLPGLPPKGDVTDWINGGGTSDELVRIAQASPTTIEQPKYGILLSEIEVEKLRWIWQGYLPLGKVVVLDGDPGLGKSTLALDLASRVTRGMPMPDDTPGINGGVVILSGEDGLPDTVKPRLLAAGADVGRIVSFDADDPDETPPSFPSDVSMVERLIERVDAKLVIVDPFAGFLDGDVNAHKDQDIRRAMLPLTLLAQRKECTIILIRHLNKTRGGPALYRGGGSIAISGAARSVLLVAADPLFPGLRVLAQVKTNLGVCGESLSFSLESDGGEVARIDWHGKSGWNADQLLSCHKEDEGGSALELAEIFLKEVLATGPKSQAEIKAAAKDAGHSWATIRRAYDSLKVKSHKSAGRNGVWLWYGPGSSPESVEPVKHPNKDAQPRLLSIIEEVEQLPDPEPVKESIRL